MESKDLLDQEDQLANAERVKRYERKNQILMPFGMGLMIAAFLVLLWEAELDPWRSELAQTKPYIYAMTFLIVTLSLVFAVAIPALVIALFKVYPIPYWKRFFRWYAWIGIGVGSVVLILFLLSFFTD